MAIFTASQFVEKARVAATNYKTLYVYACFGAPMNATNKKRYTNNCAYNKQPARTKKINAASSDTFGFDCVCLIKGLFWGWNGNVNAIYGGANYCSNGVPDLNANDFFNQCCTNKSRDFSNIQAGELVWMNGHIGIAIGNGLAVECTPIWKDGVQITAIGNIGSKSGYNTRTWTQHGRCKFIDYGSQPTPPTPTYKYKIGDKVVVTGQLYGSSDGSNPGRVVEGVVTNITRIAQGAKYPYNTTGDLGWVAETSLTPYVEPTPTPTPTPTPETFPFTGIIPKGTTLYTKHNGNYYPAQNKTYYDRKVEVQAAEGEYYQVYGETFSPHVVYVKKGDVKKVASVDPLNVGDTVVIRKTGYSNAYGVKGHTAFGIGWTRKIIRIYDGKAYPYQVGEGNVTIGFYKADALEKK